MDRPTEGTALCLACSSSLPPRRIKEPSALSRNFSESASDIFFTPCCHRPVCPTCLASNPRLARYNPCLHCFGGVKVVSARSSPLPQNEAKEDSLVPRNVDGGVHDEDVFVVGDEEEEGPEDRLYWDRNRPDEMETMTGDSPGSSAAPPTPPPPYEIEPALEIAPSNINVPEETEEDPGLTITDSNLASLQSTGPHKYHIQPGDTLLGISLKFGVDGRTLCRLNGLPPSTLRTTPNLLHTRTVLTLPRPARNVSSLPSARSTVEDEALEARRAREKAAKRFQTLTKEVDWRVAKAYVAVAEHTDNEDGTAKDVSESNPPEKKILVRDPFTGAESSLEGRAIDRYLDDDEWEQRERQAGRGVSIPRFPLFEPKGQASASKPWWQF